MKLSDQTPERNLPPSALRLLVRWTARVFSIIPLAVLVIGYGAELVGGAQYSPQDIFVFFGLLVVLILAWWRELLGGGLAFVLISAHAYLGKLKEEPWFDYIVWTSAFLFLLSGSLDAATDPAAIRSRQWAARIFALLCLLLALLSLYSCNVHGRFNG